MSGVGQILDRAGLTIGDVATCAVHHGGARILARVGHALDLDVGDLAISAILADDEHCSSATILMILRQFRVRLMGPGADVVAVDFGSGVTAAAMLFRCR